MTYNKYFRTVAIVAVFAFALSCNKDSAIEDNPVIDLPEGQIRIEAALPDLSTKVDFLPAYDTDGKTVSLGLTWAAGDAIRVYDHSDRSQYNDFTVESSAVGQKRGTFVGETSNIGSATAFDVEVIGGSGFNYASQTQPSDGVTSGLKYLASASNLSSYESFTFTELSSVLAITAKMPSPEVAAAIKSIDIAASEDIFNGGDELTITLSSTGDAGSDGVLNFFATLPQGSTTVPAGTTLLVHFNAPGTDHDVYTRFIELDAGTFTSAKLNTININASQSDRHAGATSCDGTADAKAYLIGDKYQMLAMGSLMESGATKYFKMIDDIDLNGVDWKSLNGAGNYDKKIHFDGDGHTISNFFTSATTEYPSFFGVLYGSCKNVRFVKAVINTTANGVGILGGYGGTGGKPAVVENVHVQGSVTGGGSLGGLFGNVRECTIDRCSADVTLTSTGKNVGGLFGNDKGGTVIVRNCFTSGSLQSLSSICGGIGGDIVVTGSSIYNCYSTMTVKTQFVFGGILGRACAGVQASSSNANSKKPENHIEKCIAWNDELSSNCTDTSEHYSNGAIIGGTSVHNYLTDCIRKPDMVFNDVQGNIGKGYDFFDQDNSSPTVDLVKGTGTYAFAYHGKAAASGKTISDVARDLSWDETVWDLSGDTPVLR